MSTGKLKSRVERIRERPAWAHGAVSGLDGKPS